MDDPDQDDPDQEGDWQRPVDKFKRSTLGSVVAAGLLGVRDALEGRPEKEEVTIVAEAPAQPARGNIDLVLDLEHPERSVAIVRRAAPDDEATGLEEEGRDEPV
ncbi:MAG: hypothetical protein ACHQDE_00390 [Acidimicrobiia bacterium]